VGEDDGAPLLFQRGYPFGEGLSGTGRRDGITTLFQCQRRGPVQNNYLYESL